MDTFLEKLAIKKYDLTKKRRTARNERQELISQLLQNTRNNVEEYYDCTSKSYNRKDITNELCNIFGINERQLYDLSKGYKKKNPDFSIIFTLIVISDKTCKDVIADLSLFHIPFADSTEEPFFSLSNILFTLCEDKFVNLNYKERLHLAEILLEQCEFKDGISDLAKLKTKKQIKKDENRKK